MIHDSIPDRYAEACRTPSDIHEHLPVFVEMVEELKATKVIELGTRGGVSTIAWLYALDLTDGHCWSVDIEPAPQLPTDRWTFVQGDDLDPDVYAQLPDDVDIVFIDTSHTYRHTLAELNLYRYKVRAGGRIVLHDTEYARPIGWSLRDPTYPVKTAVEEFCRDEFFPWTNLANNNGLGIIEV